MKARISELTGHFKLHGWMSAKGRTALGQDGAIIFGIDLPGEQTVLQQNRRVCRPCMITLREGTTFDAAAPGDVA
jgi:hypothetical protein